MLKSSFCLFVVPSGRWGHDMCLTDKSKAVLIGGQGRKLQMAKDSVWTLDFANGELMMLTSLGNNSSWYSVQIKDTVQQYFILSLQLPAIYTPVWTRSWQVPLQHQCLGSPENLKK